MTSVKRRSPRAWMPAFSAVTWLSDVVGMVVWPYAAFALMPQIQSGDLRSNAPAVLNVSAWELPVRTIRPRETEPVHVTGGGGAAALAASAALTAASAAFCAASAGAALGRLASAALCAAAAA